MLAVKRGDSVTARQTRRGARATARPRPAQCRVWPVFVTPRVVPDFYSLLAEVMTVELPPREPGARLARALTNPLRVAQAA